MARIMQAQPAPLSKAEEDEAALIQAAQQSASRFTPLYRICYLMRTSAPDWTPDGQWLVFPAAIDGNWEKVAIYAIPVEFPLTNPKDLVPFRLTDEGGLDINPQVQPDFKPLSIEPKPVRAGEITQTEIPTP